MDRDDRLAELLVRWEDAARAGSPLAPEDVCRDDPDLLPEFRRLIGRVGLVHALLAGTPGPADPADLEVRLLAGRFRPLGFHAAGGLGVVFTAEDTEVGRTVAVKCLQGWAGADEVACRRFLLEAQVTGRLEHPGVVPVYGVGRDARGRPYYAMRFVGGPTLQDAIDRYHADPAGPSTGVEFRRLLRAVVQVCQTAAYAHDRGIVHRDVKPANVLLGPYGETLLVDWGLAHRATDPANPPVSPADPPGGDAGRTVPGVAAGTYAFMGPEQAHGDWQRVGPASDVFALGATLYAVLTGHPPYRGPDPLARAKTCAYSPPRIARPGVPTALAAVCGKAMARQPEDRYPGAAALAADIERWLADEPVTAWREPFTARAWRWTRRHRPLVAAGMAAVVVATALSAATATVLRERNRELDAANNNLDAANTDLRTALTTVRADSYYRTIALADRVWWDGRVAEADHLLNDTPPGGRRWEWFYLKHRCRTTLAAADLPGARVRATLLPDGRRWVVMASDGTARILDLTSGAEVSRWSSGSAGDPVVSAGGQRVAFIRRSNEVSVHNSETGGLVRTVPGPTGQFVWAALSGDGRRLAVAGPEYLSIWDVDAGRSVVGVLPAGVSVRGLAVSRDGSKAAVAGLRVVNPEAYRRLKLRVPGRRVIIVFDAATGQPFSTIETDADEANDGAWGPLALSTAGGWVAAPGADPATVCVWIAPRTHDLLPVTAPDRTLFGHADRVTAVGFSADGTVLATGSADRSICVWGLTNGGEPTTPPLLRVWGVTTGQARATLRGHDGQIDAVIFATGAGRLVSAGLRAARVWDASTGSEARSVFLSGPVLSASPALGGTVLTVDADGRVWVRDATTGRDLWSFNGRTSATAAVTVDGQRLADVIDDGRVRLRKLPDGAELRAFSPVSGRPQAVAVSQDGRRVAAAGSSEVVVWDADTGTVVAHLTATHGASAHALAFAPDGRRLAVVASFPHTPGNLTVWDVDGSRELVTITGLDGPARTVAWDPGGVRLFAATGDARTIGVWDAATGRSVLTLRGHRYPVVGLGFVGPGRLVSIGSGPAEAEFKVWDGPGG